VDLGLSCFALVSPPDDAEDRESDDDHDSQERDVHGWSGIRSNKRGWHKCGDHSISFREDGRARRCG
jgi:hypothetical protein